MLEKRKETQQQRVIQRLGLQADQDYHFEKIRNAAELWFLSAAERRKYNLCYSRISHCEKNTWDGKVWKEE